MTKTVKGIVLAGGYGTRLYPVTKGISKQLLPVYDKPMIYYPLSVLMTAGIREILLITTESEQPFFQRLLVDGSHLGLSLSYIVQPSPDGLAQAFILGKQFIGDDPVCMVLGDNIFYGHGLSSLLQNAQNNLHSSQHATIFGFQVSDPQSYGVIEFDAEHRIVDIEEKPATPKSSYAVTGLYFYPNDVVEMAKTIKPSARGELEITSINNTYLKAARLQLELMGQGYAWLDTGTAGNLLEASHFIQTIEKRQGLKVACLEEIAYRNGYIDIEQLAKLAGTMKNQYGRYLAAIVESHRAP